MSWRQIRTTPNGSKNAKKLPSKNWKKKKISKRSNKKTRKGSTKAGFGMRREEDPGLMTSALDADGMGIGKKNAKATTENKDTEEEHAAINKKDKYKFCVSYSKLVTHINFVG